jgi:pimeloyl-ACP methyl ester carboxylesterase
MPFLDLPGGRIRYEQSGSGYPALLFAPGFLSSRIERWRSNPAKPGAAQDWVDPIPVFSPYFHVIALDVRNAGESRVAIGPGYDWNSYTEDHLALLRHLGVAQCHVMGACIGVSFAFGLAQAGPGLVTSMVLQNPIGLSGNREVVQAEYDDWAAQVAQWPGIDRSLLPALGQRMFGGDFLYSVTRDFVAACGVPMLLMPGNDRMHPAATSSDIARLGRAELVDPWKGPGHRDAAIASALQFLRDHTPESSR